MVFCQRTGGWQSRQHISASAARPPRAPCRAAPRCAPPQRAPRRVHTASTARATPCVAAVVAPCSAHSSPTVTRARLVRCRSRRRALHRVLCRRRAASWRIAQHCDRRACPRRLDRPPKQPLPGLLLMFSRRTGVLAASTLILTAMCGAEGCSKAACEEIGGFCFAFLPPRARNSVFVPLSTVANGVVCRHERRF